MDINQQSLAYGAAKSAIREIAAYAAARKAEIGAEHVFDFSLGNPSVPAPDAVRASIERSLALPSSQVHGYTPGNGLPSVRAAVAASLERRFGAGAATADDLYLTCGAAASIVVCLHALVNPGDEVIVIAPYFPEYRVWIETAGARCVEVMADEHTFHIDADAVAAAVTSRTKAVIVNSPNNPVGVVYPRENLAALSAAIGPDVTIIADEPYREITYGAEVPWVPSIHPRTLVCYSYSKALSLPGERIGWVLVPPPCPAHDQLVPAIAGAGRKLGYVCAPALFQRVLADCVDEPADVAAYERNRVALTSGLARLGYEFVEPQGAFYLWLKALEPDEQAFFERARELELLPVPSSSFGCGGWVRVGYCVEHATIVDSLPAWEKLAASYGRSAS